MLIGILVTLGVLANISMRAGTNRQAMIHEQGSSVMPFDLDRTTHVFKTTETGGIEKVIAKDAADSEQIALIQQHLEHEVLRFREGSFSDPAAIHGATMPGLTELAAGAAKITFSYAALPNGAQISYETKDPRMVDALHRWFAAQLADHGHDALGQ
ncbi:MAG: hypothetical protein M3R61_03735 [Chloroflexota bacterium]|nr:hypothetical protein [Chloroflexota bacterium]